MAVAAPADLAHLLGRTAHHLFTHYILPMVEAGELARTIPDMTRHPDQAYSTPGSPADPHAPTA